MSARFSARTAPSCRRLLAAFCAAALLAGCQAVPGPGIPQPTPPIARSTEAAAAFEAWLTPRLDATQLLFAASQDGLDLVAQVMRARQPGSGVAPPAVAPLAARVEQAASASRAKLAGQGPLQGGDGEQAMLARDAEQHVAQMLTSLQGFAVELPRLEGVARALGPLRSDDGFVLSNGLARLLAVQVRADSVFADLVVGLLTPESALLPERELQLVRRLGNETLLESLRQFEEYGHAGDEARARRDAADAAISRQRQDLAAATRKLERLRRAGSDLPVDQRASFDAVLRSYEEGVVAEREFLDALERFAPLVYAVDRGAPDVGPRLLAAFDGARGLTERVAARMQTNIARLRTLSDLGRGRKA